MTSRAVPAPRRRQSWRIVTPTLLVVLIALAWTAFWYYASNTAQATIAAWQAREAAAGRVYNCAQQELGGYPFRIEVSCAAVTADFANGGMPLRLSVPRITVVAQVYDPKLIITDIVSPLQISAPIGQPLLAVSWTRAQTSVRGVPNAFEAADAAGDGIVVDRHQGGDATLLRASHAEAHARLASGSINDSPVLDLALSLVKAQSPLIGPIANAPLDLDVVGTLRGLKELHPKPWPEPLRQLQASGGSLDIRHARVQQGDVLATAAGSLTLTPAGRLNGELALTVAGLDKLLPALGIDRLLTQAGSGGAPNKINQGLNALDRVMPGLGNVVRKQIDSPSGVAAGLALLGRPTELEGRSAIAVPLRFNDGAVFLGPVPVGTLPAIF